MTCFTVGDKPLIYTRIHQRGKQFKYISNLTRKSKIYSEALKNHLLKIHLSLSLPLFSFAQKCIKCAECKWQYAEIHLTKNVSF